MISNTCEHGSAIGSCPVCLLQQVVDQQQKIATLRAEIERLKKWQREMVEKVAAKSLDGYRELGAKCASLEEERDRWHGSWKDLHNERQELRGVLGVPIPMCEGTVIQEFDPRYPLLESAKKIVKERDEARAEVEQLKTDIAAEKGWTSKYKDAHCAALEKELDATIAEVKRTGEKAEKYHQVMEALNRGKLKMIPVLNAWGAKARGWKVRPY